MQLVHLARKLAIWHSIDRQNRLQILHGVPLYGHDLRELITVNQVCRDIFDSKRYKYVSSKRYRKQSENAMAEVIPTDMYNMPQSVFNPIINSRLRRWQGPEESEEEDDPEVIPLTKADKTVSIPKAPRQV